MSEQYHKPTDLYRGYTVEQKDDTGMSYCSPCAQDDGLTIRAFYSICRVPSTKTIVVRCKKDATEKERALVEKAVHTETIRAVLHHAEQIGATFRKRREDGTYLIYGHFGGKLDDPLIDLELELMLSDELMTFEDVSDAYPKLYVSDLFRMGYDVGADGKWRWRRSVVTAWVAGVAS